MNIHSVAQSYMSIQGSTPLQPGGAAAAKATDAGSSTTAAPAASTRVSISGAAREAARSDATAGAQLPEFISSWFNKAFPQDVIDEAKARLADTRAIEPFISDRHGAANAPRPASATIAA